MAGIGVFGHIGYNVEASYDTYKVASYFIEALSESLALKIDRFDIKNIMGKGSEPDDMAGLRHVEGDISFAGFPKPLGYFLNAVLGSETVVATANSLGVVKFRQSVSGDYDGMRPLPSLCFEINRDVTSAFLISGCEVSKLVLACQPNQDLRVTASVIGKTLAMGAKTDAGSVYFPGSPSQPFAFDTASIQIYGAASAIFESFEVTFDNQLDPVAVLNNSNKINRTYRKGPPMVRVSATMEFNDLAEFGTFQQQSEFAITANFTRAGSFGLMLNFPRVIFSEFPVNIGGRERILVKANMIARYDSSSGTVEARLGGLQTSYLS